MAWFVYTFLKSIKIIKKCVKSIQIIKKINMNKLSIFYSKVYI